MLVGENDCAFVVGSPWALPAWKRCIWHRVPQELDPQKEAGSDAVVA